MPAIESARTSGDDKMRKQDEVSNKQKVELLLALRGDLEKEGFRISWRNPSFEPDVTLSAQQPFSEGLRFYIPDVPVPQIAPHDSVSALISAEDDCLYFSLSVSFCKALEEAIEVPDIEKVYERHDSIWFPVLVDYFRDIQDKFLLKWDVEYDVCIEDSLFEYFPLDGPGEIISLVRALLERHERR
jgi:hypothetical protein